MAKRKQYTREYKSKSKNVGQDADIKTLQAKIGELIIERNFLARAFDR
jgi:hypothetical protein